MKLERTFLNLDHCFTVSLEFNFWNAERDSWNKPETVFKLVRGQRPFLETPKFELKSISQWQQQKPKLPAAAALQVCRGHGSVRSVASSMKASTAIYTNTRMKCTMNWFATFVCSPSSDLWTPHVATRIAFIAWAAFWKSRTSALWTASGCSCTSAVLPACWSGTCWTSWLWHAPTIQSVSSRCSAVNCSLICTTGKILAGIAYRSLEHFQLILYSLYPAIMIGHSLWYFRCKICSLFLLNTRSFFIRIIFKPYCIW